MGIWPYSSICLLQLLKIHKTIANVVVKQQNQARKQVRKLI